MKTSRSVHWIGLGLFIFFLTGCGSLATQSTVTAPVTASRTLTVSPTGTTSPSAIVRPTQTVLPPSATPAGIKLSPVVATVAAHPLALNEFNAGTEMKRVNIYGTGTLQDITFSPDGKYLAAATSRGIYFYDGKTFDQVSFIDINDSVGAIAFSPDGLVIAVAINGKVSLWSTLSGQKLSTLDGELVSIWTLVYGKGGHIAVTGTKCRGCGSPVQTMILWDVKTGQQIYVEDDIWYWTEGLAFTSDGKQLAFGAKDGLTIVDTETGKIIYPSDETSKSSIMSEPFDFIFTDDNKSLFVISMDDKRKQIFDISTQQVKEFSLCDFYIRRTNRTGVCPVNEQVVFFDLSSTAKIAALDLPGFYPGRMLFAIDANGDYFAYASSSFGDYGPKNTLHIFNIKTGFETKTLLFDGFEDIQAATVTLDGKRVNVVGIINLPGQLDLLDVETSAILRTFKLATNTLIESFAFRPDGKIIATMDEKSTLTLWDLQSGKSIYQTILGIDLENQFAFSPDGLDILFTLHDEKDVFNLNLLRGETSYLGKGNQILTFDATKAGDLYHFNDLGNLVTLEYQNDLPVFMDIKTSRTITIPYKVFSDPEYIEAFALSTNGKLLTIGNTTNIFVWDIETLKQTATLRGHEMRGGDGWAGKIRSLIFSPQSNLLVSVGWDGTTRLWNINGGQELRRLNVCCSVTFTADGRFLLTAGDGVLRVWGIPKRP